MSVIKTILVGGIVCVGVIIIGLLRKRPDPIININKDIVDVLDYKYVLKWLQKNKSIIKGGAELVTLRNDAAKKLLKEHLNYEMSSNEIFYVLQLNDEVLTHLVVKYNSISDSYLDMLGKNDIYTQKIG